VPHPIWPLFDLRVTTPRLELRYVDDELGAELALLAALGIHDPDFMPFGIPWTDQQSPELERNALRYYWRTRVETRPEHWDIPFAVIHRGQVVGTTSLLADHFPTLRQFETGSWLGRAHQGQGIGTEMRHASLHLGFAGLGATRATTAAWEDNGPSLAVTAKLGYRELGTVRKLRRDQAGHSRMFFLDVDRWTAEQRRSDIRIDGFEACLELLGLSAPGE
jgi:RimJ/RimL family protein N-acetyltransferase